MTFHNCHIQATYCNLEKNLAVLKHTVQQRWLITIQETAREIQPYWNFYEGLMIEGILLPKVTKIIIPTCCR